MEWDINDATIPNNVNRYDSFQDWPDDHIRLVYPIDCEPARRHASGWAMRNTNNHNVHILKKSCLGVLVCSQRCKLNNSNSSSSGGGQELRLRPAICDKARKKQLGKACPNPKCSGGGILILIPCKGNSGFPCTHFWRHTNNAIFFQAKGIHDHAKPEIKTNNLEVRKTISRLTSVSPNRPKTIRKKKTHAHRRSNPLLTPSEALFPLPENNHAHHLTDPHSHTHPSLISNDIKPLLLNDPGEYSHLFQYQPETHPLLQPNNQHLTTSTPNNNHTNGNTSNHNHHTHQQPICLMCNQHYCVCYHNNQTSHNHHTHHNTVPVVVPPTEYNNGYQTHPHNYQDPSTYNGNQESFKPSDIFNFEVSTGYYPYHESGPGQQPPASNQYYEYWNSNWN